MATVCIETTIPSFYYTDRSSVRMAAWREQTRLWWNKHRPGYEIVTSLEVIREVRVAPLLMRDRAMALLDGVEQVAIDAPVIAIAEHYLEQKLMPRAAQADAVHVAAASYHSIDFLLTWNCRHIANANKFRHLATLNRRLGLHVPLMVTPYNLIGEVEP